MTKELIVVLPVYNEAQIIQTVIEDWATTLRALNIDFELRAYNDGSTDDTLIKLRAIVHTYPELNIIEKPNSGHGPTILKGYREANATYIFQVDSDNEMKAKYFEALWKERANYDFIIGRRAFSFKVPLPRRIVSFMAKKAVHFFYGRGISDVNAPYRLMKKDKFATIYAAIPANTFAPNVIISGMAIRKKLSIKDHFVPTDFRATGTVSIQRMKLLKVAMMSFRETISFAFSNRS